MFRLRSRGYTACSSAASCRRTSSIAFSRSRTQPRSSLPHCATNASELREDQLRTCLRTRSTKAQRSARAKSMKYLRKLIEAVLVGNEELVLEVRHEVRLGRLRPGQRFHDVVQHRAEVSPRVLRKRDRRPRRRCGVSEKSAELGTRRADR